jgi:HK97 family phage major capsid protein
MSNIREIMQRHDNAVAVMTEAAKDMQTPGLTEVRLKELQDKFDAAEKDEASITGILSRAKAAERFQKEEAEKITVETENRERTTVQARDKSRLTDEKLQLQRDAFLYALQYGPEDLTKEERTLLGNRIEARGTATQIAGTLSLGGYLVPVLLQNEIIKTMKSYAGILQVARIRNTSTGAQMTFPARDSTGRAAVLVAESGSIAVQDITYSQKTMDAYKYGDALKVSWELLQDSEFDILQEFTDAFGESFGRAANTSLTTGTGTSQPNGVVTASTLGTTAASTTAVTLAEIIDFSHSVDPAYRDAPTSGYMMNDSILAVIKKLSLAATNMGAGTWQPSLRDGTPATLNGYSYWVNQGMSSAMTTGQKIMLFGDFGKYNVRQTKDMTIMRNDFSAMATGEVAFYAHARWDGELFDTASVKHLKLA